MGSSLARGRVLVVGMEVARRRTSGRPSLLKTVKSLAVPLTKPGLVN